MDDLDLATRPRLPDPLRALLAEFPRDGWEAHPHFVGLVQFWLDRHMMFRQLTEVLQTDVEAALDRKLDPQQHKARLSRFGGMLVGQLHGHHQIEDHHYFPVLSKMEPALDRGFGVLDADHHAMDGLLARFTDAANAVLQAKPGDRDAAGAFRKDLLSFERMLGRHLEDEEDLIVPVILKHGPDRLE